MFEFRYLSQMEEIINAHAEILESNSDPRTKDWILINSIWVPVTFLVTYFLLCLWIVPHIMKERDPLDIKLFLNFYNVFVLLLNAGLTIYFLYYMIRLGYNPLCQSMIDPPDENELMLAKGFYVFFLSKLLELVDTFAILVKKRTNNQTFLHYYHHSSMIFIVWLGVRFKPGGSSAIVATINTFFHFFLYFYYHISSLHLKISEMVSFRKMALILQVVQFVVVILHCCTGIIGGCGYSRAVLAGLLIYVSTFLFLFLAFLYGPVPFLSLYFGFCGDDSAKRPSASESMPPSASTTSTNTKPAMLLPPPATIPSESFKNPNQTEFLKTQTRSVHFGGEKGKSRVETKENELTNTHINSTLQFQRNETSQKIDDKFKPITQSDLNDEKWKKRSRYLKEKYFGVKSRAKNKERIIDQGETSISKTSLENSNVADHFKLKPVHRESSASIRGNTTAKSSSKRISTIHSDGEDEKLFNRKSKWEKENIVEYFQSQLQRTGKSKKS